MKTSCFRCVIGIVLVVSLVFASISPVMAQPGRRPPGRPGPPPPHHHHHGPSDFDKTMRVIGAVGAIAAAANGYSSYGYYRHSRPVVVVPQPRAVIVDRPVVVEKPVLVEKVIEKPIIVEKVVPVASGDFYSYRLGAAFRIENMQIPGYKFKAARLTSTPVDGSPLTSLGLVKGDVITRLNNDSVDSLEVLDRYERNTLIRFIKSGTTKVRQDRIYIPTDNDIQAAEEEMYFAP